jgi:hypothetical protein
MNNNAPSSLNETAIWYPFWYEMDIPIEVGQIEYFEFYLNTPIFYLNAPECHDSVGLPIFLNGAEKRDRYLRHKRKIISIFHTELGNVQKIDTTGLDYTITLTDGTQITVNAEESPGFISDDRKPIEDWRFWVNMESA